MVAKEGDVQIIRAIVKKEAQSDVPTKFEGSFRELANAQSYMQMRLAKGLRQFAQSQQAFNPPILGQGGQSPDDSRINDEWFLQASF
jgi:hypothetical protein